MWRLQGLLICAACFIILLVILCDVNSILKCVQNKKKQSEAAAGILGLDQNSTCLKRLRAEGIKIWKPLWNVLWSHLSLLYKLLCLYRTVCDLWAHELQNLGSPAKVVQSSRAWRLLKSWPSCPSHRSHLWSVCKFCKKNLETKDTASRTTCTTSPITSNHHMVSTCQHHTFNGVWDVMGPVSTDT